MFKFIHAADLHVDSPLRGLDTYENAPVQRLRGATRQALVALVELAIEQRVDVVILAGDIYDGDWADFKTGLFFREQMIRLTRAGIRVFIAKGNHDAQSVISRHLPPVEGVHVFSSRAAEVIELANLGVAIHGRSFPDRAVPDDLVPTYGEPVGGAFNIGVLHTSLSGNADHATYAPTSEAALVAKGFDYFALGHIHARQVVREAHPRIVFPGNLQGRHAKETGPKGCELVTVIDGAIASTEFVPLDVVRWHQVKVDASGAHDVDALSVLIATTLREQTADALGHLHAVRLTIHGESALHLVEAAKPGQLAAVAHAATQDLDGVDVWIEQVRLELRSPLDRVATAARPDAVGEVVRLVDSLLGDEAFLKEWAAGVLDAAPALPRDLADAAPMAFTGAQLREALMDAEASVLVQLSGLTSGEAGA